MTAPDLRGNFAIHFERTLVLCAHTDDEFGCAGLISRLVEGGREVRYLALSRCEESVPEPYPPDVLEHECRECLGLLGLPNHAVEVWDFPVRHFPARRQEILERLVALRRAYDPDLVLLPSTYDTHQDHACVNAEGFRAFKFATVLGYEMPQNLVEFSHSAFVALNAAQLERKIRALAAYRSQEFRSYAADSFVRSLAHVRGVQCDAEYAEAYEVIRLLIR
jgi:LmbE family N-acetylglucosaminyl deacetylase